MLLWEVVTRGAVRHPGRVAVVAGDREVCFAELEERIGRLATALGGLAARGDRVAVVADNCVEYVDAYYGVPRAGMVMAVLNQRLHPSELAWIVRDADPAVIIGQRAYLEPLMTLRAELPGVRLFVGIDGGGDVSYDQLLAGVSAAEAPAAVDDERDAAWLIYTSGTTGRPKGAMLTHRGLLASAQSTAFDFGVQVGDSYVFPFPMCHVTGYTVVMFHLFAGTVILPSRFTPAGWVETVVRRRPTVSALAPTMINMVLEDPALDGADLSSLRFVMYGASSIPASVLARALDRFGTAFEQGYGGTEMGGLVCRLDAAAHQRAVTVEPRLLTAAGRPMTLVDVRVVDDAMVDVAVDRIGEVVVRGDQVMVGYWGNQAATDAAFGGGWFHTGDLARVDADGFVHIVDRMHDMIVTGGENVYPREVEDVLHSHPAVLEAAVFAAPNENWVDAVVAAVVVRRGMTVTAEELVEHCRGQLASYKKPRRIMFVDELPKNASGKILRREMRSMVASIADQTAGAL